jgi:hypothetical protein
LEPHNSVGKSPATSDLNLKFGPTGDPELVTASRLFCSSAVGETFSAARDTLSSIRSIVHWLGFSLLARAVSRPESVTYWQYVTRGIKVLARHGRRAAANVE